MNRVVRIAAIIIAILIALYLARGPDGFICKNLYNSQYTETMRAFYKTLAGGECR